MKAGDIIEQVDSLKRNQYSEDMKLRWLSDLDIQIKSEIYDTHDCEEVKLDLPYDTDTELLVEAPYDVIYRYKLESEIDYCNNEINRYNNSVAMLNNAFSNYRNYFNKYHLPLSTKITTDGRRHILSNQYSHYVDEINKIKI